MTSRAALSKQHIGILLLSSLVLCGAGAGLRYGVHAYRGDKRPSEQYVAASTDDGMSAGHAAAMKDQFNDPELDSIREAIKKDPQDLSKQRALAAKIGDIFRNDPQAPQSLALEAIDALSAILKANPKDAEALLMMADVSFDRKAFPKAIEFYKRYLDISPDDLGARARYASTLTFLGKFDDSIAELKKVMAKDPKNFPAAAYLSITYAEKGDMDQAKKSADLAMKLAPSDEARQRFSSFVNTLGTEAKSQPQEESPRGNVPAKDETAPGSGNIDNFIKNNPIAGPKFVRSEQKEPGVLRLVFKDFPMQMMPPFAKEKFFSSIKTQLKAINSEAKTVVFVDQDSGNEMDKLETDAN